MKCPNCGAPREAGDQICFYCGSSFDDVKPAADADQRPVVHVHYHQETSQPQQPGRVERVYVPQRAQSSRNRLAALIMCIFFGGLGIHKFYLGKVGMGLLYLFTGGLFGIGWFIDVVLLLLGTPKDKYGYPVTWF